MILTLEPKEDNYLVGKYHLFEVSDAGIAQLLEQSDASERGPLITFKGEDDEEVVMCTLDKTFKVREVNTSNLLLLIENESGKVLEMTNNYLEANKTIPSMNKLKETLLKYPFEGVDQEEGESFLPDILKCSLVYSAVQGSDLEIDAFLFSELNVFEINGYYRIIGPEYTTLFLKNLLAILTLNDWNIEGAVDKTSVLTVLFDELLTSFGNDSRLIEHLLNIFTISITENSELIRWNIDKISRFFCEELFRAKSIWTESDLLESWQKLLSPSTINPSLSLLPTIAIPTSPSMEGEARWRYFPLKALPHHDAAEYFRLMFGMSERWNVELMEHYVRGIAGRMGLTSLDLIVKHCRLSGDGTIVTPLFNNTL